MIETRKLNERHKPLVKSYIINQNEKKLHVTKTLNFAFGGKAENSEKLQCADMHKVNIEIFHHRQPQQLL